MKVSKTDTAQDKAAPTPLTAQQFIKKLKALQKQASNDNAKFFKDQGPANQFLHVRMASLFELGKAFTDMPLAEVEQLLDSPYYEARMGAVSIMDFQARAKKVTDSKKKELYNLYINRHDRINNWDLVDRGAPYIVGGYLADKPRAILYKLAKSKDIWKRRTAIVSTYFFIRQNDVADTFKIAEILVNDKEDLINKAVGSWIREAGKRDPQRLLDFLDQHATTMPRVTLRYAIEKLSKQEQAAYMSAK